MVSWWYIQWILIWDFNSFSPNLVATPETTPVIIEEPSDKKGLKILSPKHNFEIIFTEQFWIVSESRELAIGNLRKFAGSIKTVFTGPLVSS